MRGIRVLSIGAVVGFLVGVLGAASPPTAQAAWVNAAGTQFQVGGAFQFVIGTQVTTTIVPTIVGTTGFVDPTCTGGTSLALVPGLKLAGVDAVQHPIVLVVSCLESGGKATNRSRLNFIDPANGKVLKQVSTTAVPSSGWVHLVHRPDKGDLLGCGDNGALYSIDFSQFNTVTDGQATQLTAVNSAVTTCKGLTWDAEADMIYVGLAVGGGTKIGRVVRFKEGSSTLLGDFTNLPCAANGLTISGGVLLMSCEGALTIRRLDKNTGTSLGVHGTLTATGLPSLSNDPGLGDLACDPVSFSKDGNGKDVFTDGLWSRRGANGNGIVALEFPAFTCGLPSNSVVIQNGVPFSPLAAGLSAPGPNGPGQLPRQLPTPCFATGTVIDAEGDGLPDCWETSGIDFAGTGAAGDLLTLCVPVNINGDGVTLVTECASPTQKDLFVYIDYMEHHKPDPQALSQTQSVQTAGVQSVREAFTAAPVGPIRIHFQVAAQPVTFTPLSGPPTSHVNQVALTPCTAPATTAVSLTEAVDFDTVKAANFGTAAEQANANLLNAKRLAFRYVLFAHNLVGPPPNGGGSNGSGCAEVGGDDAVVSLGTFAVTTVNEGGTNVSHNRGLTTQQSGTLMHEFGHLLGLKHGGHDVVNCKPNYRSVMSYTRQFEGSPITGRRLDYSRAEDLDLNKTSLNESVGIGSNASLAAINPFFPSADKIAFGPGAWSVVSGQAPINWNRTSPSSDTGVNAIINSGGTSGCDGSGPSLLEGSDDWSNILYRASAAIDFAGGAHSESPVEMTSDDEAAFFAAKDEDNNGVGDAQDCGPSFLCTHRIDIKPSFPFPKTINPGPEANVTIAIFSEPNPTDPQQPWSAPDRVVLNNLGTYPLTFGMESFLVSVKVNNNGGGTCSISDVEDPITLLKDGIKDLKCQFPTSGLPVGTHFGVVSGFFFESPACVDAFNPLCLVRAFSARQEVTILGP